MRMRAWFDKELQKLRLWVSARIKNSRQAFFWVAVGLVVNAAGTAIVNSIVGEGAKWGFTILGDDALFLFSKFLSAIGIVLLSYGVYGLGLLHGRKLRQDRGIVPVD